MPADGLVTIYRTTDPGVAAWVADLLADRGIPSHRVGSGPDGIPGISIGMVETQVMILRSDLQARGEEVREVLEEVEGSLRGE